MIRRHHTLYLSKLANRQPYQSQVPQWFQKLYVTIFSTRKELPRFDLNPNISRFFLPKLYFVFRRYTFFDSRQNSKY